MDYDEVVAAFFQPSPAGAVPVPTEAVSPARRLRDAIEPLATHAIWARVPNEKLAEFGLDFLGGYVWGRAAALGEPEAGVVVAAFGVFEPGMVRAIYEQARATCPRDRMLEAREEATVASLSEALEGADVASAASALADAVAALDVTGRPLFAGLADRPWPADPVGQLWRACELAREHRGDSHNAASIAQGLGPVEMNVLTELWLGMPLGSYTATRGWPEDAVAAAVAKLERTGWVDGATLTAAGRQRRSAIEAATDAMQQPLVDALGPSLPGLLEQFDEWSTRCVDSGGFPPDVYKRAAG